MRCRLCERQAVSDLCHYHAEARRRVEAAFQAWKDAYGAIEWDDYLSRVAGNPETGQWAVEVAKMLLASAAGPPTSATQR